MIQNRRVSIYLCCDSRVWSGSEVKGERLVVSMVFMNFSLFIYTSLFPILEIYTVQGQSLMGMFGEGASTCHCQWDIKLYDMRIL
jgi:hypothetical protein